MSWVSTTNHCCHRAVDLLLSNINNKAVILQLPCKNKNRVKYVCKDVIVYILPSFHIMLTLIIAQNINIRLHKKDVLY